MIADPQATYSAFFQENYENALTFVTRRIGPDAAEDVVAEAFSAVWKRWGTLENPVGYLYGACKNGVKTEYDDRSRRPVVLPTPSGSPVEDAQIDDLVDERAGTRLLLKALDLTSLPVHTAVVAANLADGFDRRRVAEMMGLPLEEVHRSVRQLRTHLRGVRGEQDRAVQTGYIPRKRTGKAVLRLPPRQREVLALSALGLRPVTIAILLGIDSGDARVNLYHARKAIAAEIGVDARTEVDAAVSRTMDGEELLLLLPPYPWRPSALAVYRQAVTAHRASLERLRVGVSTSLRRNGPSPNQVITRSLSQFSVVLSVVRHGLNDWLGIASQCGSLRWQRQLRFGQGNPKVTWMTLNFLEPSVTATSDHWCQVPSWTPPIPQRKSAAMQRPNSDEVLADPWQPGLSGAAILSPLTWVTIEIALATAEVHLSSATPAPVQRSTAVPNSLAMAGLAR